MANLARKGIEYSFKSLTKAAAPALSVAQRAMFGAANRQESVSEDYSWLWNLTRSSSPPSPAASPSEDRFHWVFLGCPGVGKGTYASRLAKLLDIPHISMGDLVRNEVKRQIATSGQLSAIISKGQLVPDDIIFGLLADRLTLGQDRGEAGYILDGFPRTVAQAVSGVKPVTRTYVVEGLPVLVSFTEDGYLAGVGDMCDVTISDIGEVCFEVAFSERSWKGMMTLEQVADINLVLNLRLREDVLIRKCMGRRICSECGGNFNVADIFEPARNGVPEIIMPPLSPPSQCESKMTIRADDTEEVVRRRLDIFRQESQPIENFYRKKNLLEDFEITGGIPETWPRLLEALNLEDFEKQELPKAA